MVIATQNPVEMEGTYPLPEAQRDRFTARISMGYPDAGRRAGHARHATARESPLDRLKPVAHAADVRDAHRGGPQACTCRTAVRQYAIDLVTATRTTPTCGSAPRRGRRCSWCGPRAPTPRSTTATTSCPTTSRTSPSPCSPTGCCPTAEAQVERRRPEQVVADLVDAAARAAPPASDLDAASDRVRRALAGLTTRGRSFVAAGVDRRRLRLRPRRARPAARRGAPARAAAAVARWRWPGRATGWRAPGGWPRRGCRSARRRASTCGWRTCRGCRAGCCWWRTGCRTRSAGGPRFVLDRIEPHGDARARLPGPLGRARTLPGRAADGAAGRPVRDGASWPARSAVADTLTVTPASWRCRAAGSAGAWTRRRRQPRPRASRRPGEDDVAPREYRHGDDLRRVHWRSTARRGELMVRREEQPWQSRGDAAPRHPARARTGATGPAGSFEQAVSAAASIGVHLCRAGLEPALRHRRGRGAAGRVRGRRFEGLLLDTLAGRAQVEGHLADGGAGRAARRPAPRTTATDWSSRCSAP